MSGFPAVLLVANVALIALILAAVRQNRRRDEPGWPVSLKLGLVAALCGVAAQLVALL